MQKWIIIVQKDDLDSNGSEFRAPESNEKESENNPNSSNQKDQADCENFQEFGNRVRGGATPLNITGISEQSPRIQSPYDPKSARKPIFNIAGSLSLDKAETPATSFLGLKHYISPTKTQRKE